MENKAGTNKLDKIYTTVKCCPPAALPLPAMKASELNNWAKKQNFLHIYILYDQYGEISG
jgi:hypothetical protein